MDPNSAGPARVDVAAEVAPMLGLRVARLIWGAVFRIGLFPRDACFLGDPGTIDARPFIDCLLLPTGHLTVSNSSFLALGLVAPKSGDASLPTIC